MTEVPTGLIADEADWSFLEDESVMLCVGNAARRAARLWGEAGERDALYREGYSMVCEYLSRRPSLVDQFLRGDMQSRFFTANLYSHGIRDTWISSSHVQWRDRIVSISEIGEPDENGKSYDLNVLEYDPTHFDSGDGGYTVELVKKILVYCWFPERIMSNADPFGEKSADLAFDRKVTGDPSHRNSDVAELVDIRNVLSFNPYTLRVANNKACLTEGQMQVLFLRYALDMDDIEAALVLGIARGSAYEREVRALKKVVDYLNGGDAAW